MLPRRRKNTSFGNSLAVTSSHFSHERIGTKKSTANGTRRRKRRKKKREATSTISFTLLLSVIAALACWIVIGILFPSQGSNGVFHVSQSAKNTHLRSRLSSLMRFPKHQRELDHAVLYDEIFLLQGGLARDVDEMDIPPYDKRPYNLTFTYGSNITKRGCSLTVIFMDPRLATLGPGKPAWYALESIAAFAPDSCVVLQASRCEVQAEMEAANGQIDQASVTEFITGTIYKRALPLFRTLIEKGQVRVAFLNHEKYNLRGCSDFSNPSAAWMNIHYWKDEFLESDSDLILTMQDDAVLCHALNVERWRHFAYVGAVWPRVSTKLNPEPMEGMCLGMPNRWKTWLMPQRRWEQQQERLNLGQVPPKRLVARPEQLWNLSFPSVCGDGIGPIGNGGLSLRSRKWLIKAIETCPHVKYSGIDTEQGDKVFACKVFETINEDFYFGVVLRGLQAPLPTALNASLFSVEMIWPQEAVRLYSKGLTPNPATIGDEINVQGNRVTIPAGLHKPWWYHPNDLLQSDQMQHACPFLKYIFDPQQSKWKEFAEEAPWIGLGS